MITLSDLKPGDKASLQGFYPGDATYRRYLMALGLTPGTTIEVIRIAPLGDPIQIKVRHAFLAVRKQEATILKLERIHD